MSDDPTMTAPASEPATVPEHDRDEPGAKPRELPALLPPGSFAPPNPAVAVLFPKGTRVRVNRRRLYAEKDDEVPRHASEAYKATVDRVGAAGMVYLIRERGGVGVVHPDELTPIPEGE